MVRASILTGTYLDGSRVTLVEVAVVAFELVDLQLEQTSWDPGAVAECMRCCLRAWLAFMFRQPACPRRYWRAFAATTVTERPGSVPMPRPS
jgi:hypothetical protein